ncbi:MAG: hypothetical protein U0353_34005 [Sandaracinus sp.]
MAVILSFSTPDPAPLIAELRRSGLLTAEPPRDVNSGRGLQATWPEGYLGRGESSVLARMPDWSQVVLDLRSQVVQLTLPRLLSMADVRAAVPRLRFGIGAGRVQFKEWRAGGPLEFLTPSLGPSHPGLGFAFFAQGEAGHHHLVSRRWLEHGPFRLLRGEGDTSMVQLHDLDADAATARSQAQPAIRHLADLEVGGLIPDEPLFRDLRRRRPRVSGLYVAAQRALKVVAHRREITPGELLEAAGLRRYSLTPEQPIERVSYVFMSEAEARVHLHALWLRGLECCAVIDGREVRLDDRYEPPPHTPPAWVHAVDAREATG